MERARKTDLENGMVWYVSMKTYWDISHFIYTVENYFAKYLAKKLYIYSRELLCEVLGKEILYIQ